MSFLEISSREFRSKLKTYFELADRGAKIIVRRGRNRSYLITPIEDDEMTISPKLEDKINSAKLQVGKGNVVNIKSKDELSLYLENL